MKIIIQNLQKKIPIYPQRIKKAVLNTLFSEGIKKTGEITICFVDDKIIRVLNFRYLGRNRPTDVIAFDISENKEQILADIVISTDTAVKNSKAFKTSPLYEVYLYVIHGVLHILGYDDKTAQQRKVMEYKAQRILKNAHP